MISEERLEKAMVYLAHTDEEAAKAKALVKKLEKMERIIRGEAFLKASQRTAGWMLNYWTTSAIQRRSSSIYGVPCLRT